MPLSGGRGYLLKSIYFARVENSLVEFFNDLQETSHKKCGVFCLHRTLRYDIIILTDGTSWCKCSKQIDTMTRRHNSIRRLVGSRSSENYRSGLILTDKAVFVFQWKRWCWMIHPFWIELELTKIKSLVLLLKKSIKQRSRPDYTYSFRSFSLSLPFALLIPSMFLIFWMSGCP